MRINQAVKYLDEVVGDPSKGLPDEIFYYISRTTPLVNVDLLVQDKSKRTLLAWRDDQYVGKGWHLPGGIVRFRETLEQRVLKVAETEIGIPVVFDKKPLEVNQCITCVSKNRSHMISVLYRCSVAGSFAPENKELKDSDAGFLKWHPCFPKDMLRSHDMYRKYFNMNKRGKNK